MARSPDVDARRTECPTGSTQAALEITVSWEDSDKDLELHVIEPGGTEVYEYSSNKLGVSRRTPKGASCTSPANAASKITVTRRPKLQDEGGGLGLCLKLTLATPRPSDKKRSMPVVSAYHQTKHIEADFTKSRGTNAYNLHINGRRIGGQ